MLRHIPDIAGVLPSIGLLVTIGVAIVNLIMVTSDDERRSVHDRLGKTRVVYKKSLDSA